MPLPYDPSRKALYKPEDRSSVFGTGPLDTLRLCSEASRLAYLRFDQSQTSGTLLANTLALAGFTDAFQTFVHRPTDGAGYGVMNDDKVALLVFRGTQADHMLDLITNVQFGLSSWNLGPGKVHRGFELTALGLWKQVLPWLQGPAGHRQQLLICGHSLGGAIASLLAVPAQANALVTFGSPRVGDAGFVQGLAGLDSIRVVDCCDLVPLVPPTSLLLPYEHVGTLHYIDLSGTVHLSPSAAFMTQDQQQAELDYAAHCKGFDNVVTRRLADHAPINYIRAFW